MMYWVYLFGSVARKENDIDSDLDVLLIIESEEDRAKVIKKIEKHIKKKYSITPSISTYSYKRFMEYYLSGTLFAWHVYYEAKLIFSYDDSDLIYNLGKPNVYDLHKDEYELFYWLIDSISDDKEGICDSWNLEMGNLYIACRNIGIILSSKLLKRPIFSPYAPYLINKEFPIPRKRYKKYREVKSYRNVEKLVLCTEEECNEFLYDVANVKRWLQNIKGEIL